MSRPLLAPSQASAIWHPYLLLKNWPLNHPDLTCFIMFQPTERPFSRKCESIEEQLFSALSPPTLRILHNGLPARIRIKRRKVNRVDVFRACPVVRDVTGVRARARVRRAHACGTDSRWRGDAEYSGRYDVSRGVCPRSTWRRGRGYHEYVEAACFGAAVFHVAQEGTGSRAKADIDVALQVWPIGSTL